MSLETIWGTLVPDMFARVQNIRQRATESLLETEAKLPSTQDVHAKEKSGENPGHSGLRTEPFSCYLSPVTRSPGTWDHTHFICHPFPWILRLRSHRKGRALASAPTSSHTRDLCGQGAVTSLSSGGVAGSSFLTHHLS